MTIEAFEKEEWYTSAKKYWETVTPDVDGMLGGFSHLDPLDITASERFLAQLFSNCGEPRRSSPTDPMRACDMGAGIGRISKHLLLRKFDQVDLVESNKNFLDNAAAYIGESSERRGKIGQLINKGLEEYDTPAGRYHVIWCQWVLSHLTDEHLIVFLKKCLDAVRPNNGYLILKENTSRRDEYIIDDEDSSVIRSVPKWKELLKEASCEIVAEEVQPNFPQQLFPVYMWALR